MKKLVAIEGPDNVGKTTIIKKLIETGIVFRSFNFPEKTADSLISNLMKKMLSDESFHRIPAEFKALLFAVDRKAQYNELNKCLYSDEEKHSPIVLCDRYTYSNIAYQTALFLFASIENMVSSNENKIGQLISYLEFDLFRMPEPDIVICLTASNSDFLLHQNLDRHEENDLNDKNQELQIFVNRFFRSENSRPDHNIRFWHQNRVVVDVCESSTSFRRSDDILNEVIAALWVRGGLKREFT